MTASRRALARVRHVVKRPVRSTLRRLGYEVIAAGVDPELAVARLLAHHGVSCVVDVGANQGQYAEHLRALGFDGLVISFEPGASAFAKLQKASSRDPQWRALNLALGAEDGELDLNVSANSVSSSLLPVGERHLRAAPASETLRRESVRVGRLDQELTDLVGPAMLKIDTQGFELAVLQGASGVLDRIAVLQVEVSLVELYNGQPDFFEVVDVIRMLGFRPWSISPAFNDPATGQMLQVDILATRAVAGG